MLFRSPPERLKRFFTRLDGQYRINKPIRDVCVFARQDLTRDPPFSKLDLIVCRNVLIYFDRETQERLFDTFYQAMTPGGFLMLGKVETLLGNARSQFAPVDARERIFARL